MSIEDISDLESDRRVLSVSAMIQSGRAFGCSIDWLLAGSILGAPKAVHESSCIDGSLSQLESELITKFRSLKEQNRKISLISLRSFMNRRWRVRILPT